MPTCSAGTTGTSGRSRPSTRALVHFQAAIAGDPDFALAHAGLALVYGPRQVYAYVPPGTGLAEQKAAALKALELDPGLAEARAALGSARTIEWDWEGAEAEFRGALELDPNSIVEPPLVRVASAVPVDALAESQAHRRRALELDPLNVLRQPWVAPQTRRRRRRGGGPGPVEPGSRAGAGPGL